MPISFEDVEAVEPEYYKNLKVTIAIGVIAEYYKNLKVNTVMVNGLARPSAAAQ